MKCILNVTEHEFDNILQLTHDAVEWRNIDAHIVAGLETLLGRAVVSEMKPYTECRMAKHHDISGMPRVTAAPELVDAAPTRIE